MQARTMLEISSLYFLSQQPAVFPDFAHFWHTFLPMTAQHLSDGPPQAWLDAAYRHSIKSMLTLPQTRAL